MPKDPLLINMDDASAKRQLMVQIGRLTGLYEVLAAISLDIESIAPIIAKHFATSSNEPDKCEHGVLWSVESVRPREDAEQLVGEVQHRMDQVVEAAVEWHQAGREGAEWFNKAEALSTAIDSLLELKENPNG